MKTLVAAGTAGLFCLAWVHCPDAVKDRLDDAAPKAEEVAASIRGGFDLLDKMLSTPAPALRAV